MMFRETAVAVIGGGFSGAMTAAHLGARGIDSIVVEPGALGRGVAYARTGHPLLLNTPSHAMSALPDAPAHFDEWLSAHGAATTFAPRAMYGDYLEATIAQLAAGRVSQISARASSLAPAPAGWAIACDDGSQIHSRAVVLALGNAPPRRPSTIAADDAAYFGDPYRALAAIEPDDSPIAILGTGLTALDVVMGLRAKGHRGPIALASRRGLVPLAHGARPREVVAVPRDLIRSPKLRALFAWWRDRRSRGDSEVALVTALRPHLPTLWRRLPAAERARFARHVRPHWDVIRHRAPAQVRAVLDLGLADGSCSLLAARLASASRTASGLDLRFVSSAGAPHDRSVRYLVNCTGPERDLRRMGSPLVSSLLDRRLALPDSLGLGVVTGPSGELLSDTGPVPGAFVVGPWRAADLWEATAVPELRVHASDTAAAIAEQFAPVRAGSIEHAATISV